MRCTFTGSKTDQMFLDQIKSSQNVGNRITQNCYYLARESFSKALKKKRGIIKIIKKQVPDRIAPTT